MAAPQRIELEEFFKGLKEPQRKAMISALEIQKHPAGHFFGRVGLVNKRENDTVWILLEGEVSVGTNPKMKGQIPVQRKLSPGAMFGIISFLRGGSRTATTTACGAVKTAA